MTIPLFFFFSSRRRHTRWNCDWSSDVCSSDLARYVGDSCAICTASADVLAEMLEGRRRDEALAIGVGDVLETLAADVRPTRMRCVTLPLGVLAQALGSP